MELVGVGVCVFRAGGCWVAAADLLVKRLTGLASFIYSKKQNAKALKIDGDSHEVELRRDRYFPSCRRYTADLLFFSVLPRLFPL